MTTKGHTEILDVRICMNNKSLFLGKEVLNGFSYILIFDAIDHPTTDL